MAGQLNIKLFVASVQNLRVLLIFFDFILFVSSFLQFSGSGIHLKKMLLCRKKFPVHVVICILQAFSCRYLEIFLHDLYFFSLFQSQDPKE